MNFWTFLKILGALVYTLLPYLGLLWGVTPARTGRRLPVRLLPAACFMAVALFCVTGVAVAARSFDLYLQVHALLCIPAALVVLARFRHDRERPAVGLEPGDRWLLAILAAALLVRLLPLFSVGECLGSGDARFHNILARKILVERRLGATWEPFAPVGIMYPQGTHLLTAFVAQVAGCPVHQAFTGLLVIIGALTAGLIHHLARSTFGTADSANWAAGCYAFLPLWGSLDYLRWGGLPNALGMAFLCLALIFVLVNTRPDPPVPERTILAAVFCLVAVMLVHHYTSVVAAVTILFGAVFTAHRPLRRTLLLVAAGAALFGAPLALARAVSVSGELGNTSVLLFREPLITPWNAIQWINPIFIAAFIAAVVLARRTPWNARQLFMLAWFAGLLTAFVALEYLYRAGVLIATGGRDCFTALTPSRMATNLVYPMSVLCGFVPRSASWRRYRPLWIAGLGALALLTAVLNWSMQRTLGVFPAAARAGAWLQANTPRQAMLVGRMPQLEYLAWRETSHPPLPASEARRHPAVLAKARRPYIHQWLAWSEQTGRPVYFLRPPGAPVPRSLRPVFRNARVAVYTAAGGAPSP
ncbi:MAG: hypothetical protein JW951_10125 [Lentisphaerae bacterium]|nr:hypothetical protein [Lentisphaerota bacterium]